MNPKALLLFLLAALCGAAFFLLRADGEGPAAAAGPGLTSTDLSSGERAEDEGPEELAVPNLLEEDGDRQKMTLESAGGPALAAEPLMNEADGSDAVEEGVLTGRVTDGDGAPLVGASVSLTRRGLEDFFSDTRDGLSTAPDKPGADTDANGLFRVEARPGDLRVHIEADGFAPHSVTVKLEPAAETDVGEIRLAPGVILRGRVVDAEGAGVAKARLVRAPEAVDGLTILGGEDDVVAVTSASGNFEVLRQAAGTYRFFVKHSEHPPEELTGKTETPGETVTGLRVVMDTGATIRGVAVGVPAGTQGLLAYAERGEANSTAVMFRSGSDASRTVSVGADGRFELRGLAPETQYRLQLTRGVSLFGDTQRRSSWTSATTVQQGIGPEVQLRYSLGATVSFTVLDEAGVPHLADTIDAGFEYANRRDNADVDAETGRCVISGLWPQVEGQALLLNLGARGFEPWEAKGLIVYPDDQLDLGKITLKPRPSVRITVLDDGTGEPVMGARVTMAPPPKEAPATGSFRVRASTRGTDDDDFPVFEDESTRRGVTDEDGVCTLDATAGERVVLTVSDSLHAPASVGPFALPETMTEFEQEVRLVEGGGIRALALDPSGAPAVGYAVEVRGESQEAAARREGRTGADGVLELNGLKAGEHFIRLGQRGGSGMFMPQIQIEGMENSSDDDDAWKRVSVGPGEVVEVALEAPAIGELVGSVKERGVSLGGATVKLRKANDDNPLGGLVMLGGAGSPSSTTDARGQFSIADVEAGDYELVVEHSTRAMPFTMKYTIEGGEQEVDLDLSITEVSGRVFDEAGEPVAGAKVEAKRVASEDAPPRRMVSMVMMSSTGGGGGGVMMTTGDDDAEPTTTDAEGRYRLRGVAHGVDLEVVASADGYEEAKSERFSVGEGAVETDVEVRFVKPGSVRIELEGLEGSVVAILRRAGEGRSSPPKIEFITSASTTVDGLGPGKWTVRIQPASGGTISTDPDNVEVDVVGGETATASFKIL
ncbi:MAG: protocatechuate 3,4-dioxygenase beta subunit [Paracoccaceae bacterium]|jgi:protocatechuate 3,4-dioxygenase beta subunit